MASPIADFVINILLDASSAILGAKNIETTTEKITQSGKKLQSTFGATDQATQKFGETTNLVNTSGKKLQENLTNTDRVGKKLGQTTNSLFDSIKKLKDSLNNTDQSVEKFDQSSKKLASSGQQLQQSLGVTDQVTQRFGSSLKGTLVKIAGFAAFSYGIRQSANFAESLGQVSKKLNVNIEDLDAWGKSVESVGGKAENFQSSLSNLKSRGIGINKLPALADKFSGVSNQRAMQMGSNLGLDEGTITLLQRGRREVNATVAKQKEFGVVTQKDADISKNFNLELVKSGRGFQGIFRVISSEILPIFTRLLKGFNDFTEYLGKNEKALKLVGAGIGIILAALFPVEALFLIISGLIILIVDDILAFQRGNNSLIGDILKRWPLVGEIFRIVKDRLIQLKDSLAIILDFLIKVFEKLKWSILTINDFLWKVIQQLKASMETIFISIQSGFDAIVSGFKTLTEWAKKLGNVFDFKKEVKLNVEAIDDNFKKIAEEKLKASLNVDVAQKSIQQTNVSTKLFSQIMPTQSAEKFGPPNRVQNNTVNIRDVTIETQSSDPNQIRDIFNTSWENELNKVIYHYDDGVKA